MHACAPHLSKLFRSACSHLCKPMPRPCLHPGSSFLQSSSSTWQRQQVEQEEAKRSCTCALLKASLHAHGLCTAEILSVACPLSQLARPTLGTSGAIPFAMLQSTRCQRGMVTNADARARFIAHNAIEYVDPPQRKGVGLRSVAPALRRPYLSECLAPIIGALHHSPAWCNRKLI